VPQIPILLQAEPEVGWHLQHPGEPQGGVWGDATLPVDQLIALTGSICLTTSARH
jgi:hypothetical protein